VGGAWEGPVSFRKPFSFGLSFGLTTITLAWFADRLRLGRTAGWALLLPIVLANSTEVVWVSLQRARSVASHFNFATPLDEALYTVMGAGAIAVSALATITLTVFVFLRRTEDPALTLAMRAGLVLLLIAMISGGAMIAVGNGRAELGQTDHLVRWGAAGNMKITHLLGMHGIQVLPALALYLSATAMPAGLRTRVMAVAVAGYSGLLVAAAAEARADRGGPPRCCSSSRMPPVGVV
jgi:hypothetical protein